MMPGHDRPIHDRVGGKPRPRSRGENVRPLTAACLLLALLLSPLPLTLPPSAAADLPMEFSDPTLQRRYQHLLTELRCLVCQNQSLADSHADLAQDLRQEVYQQVLEGKSDQAITEFLIARYGDFVIYRPPFDHRTALLWAGPFILLLGAILFLLRLLGKQRADSRPTLTEAERARLKNLLNDKDR